MSVREHISETTCPNFANSSTLVAYMYVRGSGLFASGVVMCYVLPVLWMTSCLPIIGQTKATRGRLHKVTHQGHHTTVYI